MSRTNWPHHCAALCLALFPCLISNWAVAKEQLNKSGVLRAALVDVGRTTDLPKGLMDLLLVELSSVEVLEFVEREEIQKVLQEQKLSLAFGQGMVSENSVQVGKLISAEAIVMLAAEPEQNGSRPIRVRIVDTKHGIRYWESLVQWPAKESDIPTWIQSFSIQLVGHLAHLGHSEKDPLLISVADFVNQELARQTDWLGPLLRASLEQRLSEQPMILLMERDEVLPLIEERALTSDLPASLKEAAVSIDGEYKLHIEQAAVEVEVTIRLRRVNKEPITKSIRGPLSDKGRLCQAVSREVLRLLGQQTQKEFDNQSEAQLLADLGERYLTLGQKSDALRSLLASYALDPDSFRIQALLLHAGRGLASNAIWGSDRLKGDQREKFRRQTVPLLMLLTDVGHKLLSHKEFPTSSSAPWDPFYHRDQVMFAYSNCFMFPPRVHRYLGAEDIESAQSIKILQEATARLYEKHLKTTQTVKDRQYYSALSIGISSAPWWEKSPSEALARRVKFLELADDLVGDNLARDKYHHDANLMIAGAYFDLDRIPTWPERYDLHQLYREHLQQLSKSSRLLIRVRAEWAWATYYARQLKDKEKSIDHYERFVDLVTSEVLPNCPAAHSNICHWVMIDNPGIPLSDREAGAFYSKVIRAAFDNAFPKYPQLWEYLIMRAYQYHEAAGHPEKADQLLQDCIACLAKENVPETDIYSKVLSMLAKLTGWRDTLQARHPKMLVSNNSLAQVTVSTRLLFDIDTMERSLDSHGVSVRSLWFRRIVPTDRGWLLLSTHSGEDTPVLVWLDTQTFAVKSVTTFPGHIRRDPVNDVISRIYNREGPSIATDEENVLVGIPGGGIVCFRPQQEPVHFSIKHLTSVSSLKRPLVNDCIRQIALFDGSAYVRTGAKAQEYALMQLELKSGQSRMLFSPRDKSNDHPLAGAEVGAVISSGDGSIILALHNSRTAPEGLIKYWPKSEKHKRLGEIKFGYGPCFLAYQDGAVLLKKHYGFMFVNPETGTVQEVFEGRNIVSSYKNATRKFRASLGCTAYCNGQLVRTGRRPGRNMEWFLFSSDEFDPKQLQGDHLPAAGAVRGLLLTGEDKLLVLTAQKVFLVDAFNAN